ncbi:hypothetical protein [Pseudonocardia aurantiaca]|uniref:Uncharacterized protein n=1 Tax=Pseudonocardia aurantiaca TaxID=75290 RepID=A0ABW4FGM3_9PSEU
MFTDFSLLTAQSELHRKELLAEADNYRLARLASSLRRRRPVATPPTDPPEPRRRAGGPAAAAADAGSADGNHDAERRSAVSR